MSRDSARIYVSNSDYEATPHRIRSIITRKYVINLETRLVSRIADVPIVRLDAMFVAFSSGTKSRTIARFIPLVASELVG
jgi:hypothetical protein